MTDQIQIAGVTVPRTIAGALNRLELIAAQHSPESDADVQFLRDQIIKLRDSKEST